MTVFTVSDDAVLAIRRLSTLPDAPPGAGLRISGGDDARTHTLRLSLAAQPHPGDQVHEADDHIQVYVAEEAAGLLEGKTLDARTDDSGQVRFLLDAPQT
ncbi:Fe-S cluster assembly protein HesB [Actinoplanes solisilvae]|uniref:Fe-S cluster assembly protein HesB n=1 Tax=Actinoplanes solisilvae TaxID=2486853 RepID=UPI000FDAD254|nr:Fe-S cluster assembly protein HesB [Actinoplanes solisilvae]